MQGDVTTAISCDALLDSGGGAKNLAAKPPRILSVLVACEYSGAVRDAFTALGHDALSCDMLPSEKPGFHHQGDVLEILDRGWDIIIAHPPCTYLNRAGWHWVNKPDCATLPLKGEPRRKAAIEAAQFFRRLMEAPCEHIAIENPRPISHANLPPHSQVIHPWQYGHGETKTTCLWLKNLPPLKPTNIVEGREQRIFKMPPGPNRSKERSRTYSGIAYAMADQWSAFLTGAVAPPPLESNSVMNKPSSD